MTLAWRSPFFTRSLLVVALVAIGHAVVVLTVASLPLKRLPEHITRPKVHVKLVQITEPKVTPIKPTKQPKPKEHPKPKNQPKEVKVVEKPIIQSQPKPVIKPKIVTQKATEIKAKDKVVLQDDLVEKERLEQQRLEKERLERERLERERVEQDRLAKEQAERERLAKEQAEKAAQPRNLGDAAQVAWKKKPHPRLTAQQLKVVTNNQLKIRIQVDAAGRINPSILQSSGNDAVDREFLRAVRNAQFYPYSENGVAVPFYAVQVFQLQ